MKTRAEEFAEYFDNDGQSFEMPDGTTFSENLERLANHAKRRALL